MRILLSIFSLSMLLFVSSCKKQIFISDIQNKNKQDGQVTVQKSGEEDVFSPVSELEAKRFASSQNDFGVFSQNFSQKSIKDVSQKGLGCLLSCVDPNVCTNLISVKDVKIEDFAEFVRQKEAKLSDIPIPLNSEPIKNYFKKLFDKNKMVLAYKIDNLEKNLNDIVIFYAQEMERLGWKSIVFFDGFEKLMVFKKPSRFCVVSIRSICSIDECLQEQKKAKIVICIQGSA